MIIVCAITTDRLKLHWDHVSFNILKLLNFINNFQYLLWIHHFAALVHEHKVNFIKMFIPACTLLPTCKSFILTVFPLSRLTMALAGKHAFARTGLVFATVFVTALATTFLVVSLEVTFAAAPVEAPMVPADLARTLADAPVDIPPAAPALATFCFCCCFCRFK